ncbi:poly(A)-specific ribonuclease PARN-like [Pistacia vera]|uniref:poly(A)-specific ribonuclease PARN-like n=1 Tax=Pistacia vera TaxID=55513 RepID=UPI00126381B2|nr:poly(A)-specific ribonuclease PARN-like [Pistacia vera]XP_031267915.1 poly(A)-specific ribonuclease PARN-like [Pistacia vera]
MVPNARLLSQKRFFSTKTLHRNHLQWPIKQVTKSNFNDSLPEIKHHIANSHFIALSLQNTGSFSTPWHRLSAFDTPHTAYSKAKFAAERFQILQFAVCPFKIEARKVVAFPYNFHLFPRDELKLGMPSYSFTCQTSSLNSMAKEGFDFNACIYDGISYLSRAQESSAKVRMGNPIIVDHEKSSFAPIPVPTVADTVFVERIRSRVKHWKNACTDSSAKTDAAEALVISLRKLVLGSEQHGSRPCMTIDVCSERQVQLVLKMLEEFSDLVPLLIPAKSGGTQAVRVVLTSSEEDRDLLKRELQDLEVEQDKRVRGFREVIDLICASQKPVVSHNSLNDFAFIHSKFLAPLPPNVVEFMSSLRMAFPQVLDVNHLMTDIGPARTSMSANMSYLKNRFFAPIDMEIPHKATENESNIHGHNVVKICHLFGKLCSVLNLTPTSSRSSNHHLASAFDGYANIFNLSSDSCQEPTDEDIRVWTNNTRKVRCEDVAFLWGFRKRMSAGTLKTLLRGSNEVFAKEFDVRLVDRSCAMVVFWQPSLRETFVDIMNSEKISGALKEMVSEGLKATGYETYKRVCSSGLWELELADALDKALALPDSNLEDDYETNTSEIYWSNDLKINLDDL